MNIVILEFTSVQVSLYLLKGYGGDDYEEESGFDAKWLIALFCIVPGVILIVLLTYCCKDSETSSSTYLDVKN